MTTPTGKPVRPLEPPPGLDEAELVEWEALGIRYAALEAQMYEPKPPATFELPEHTTRQ